MKANFEELRMSIRIIQVSVYQGNEYDPFLLYIRKKVIFDREEYDTS